MSRRLCTYCLVFLMAASSGCAPPATQQDHNVLDAVIADLLASPPAEMASRRRANSGSPTILVASRTPGFSGWIMAHQVRSDTSFSNPVKDIIADLAARNRETYGWDGSLLKAPQTTVARVPKDVDAAWMASKHANARFYMAPWRPGYSSDHTRAILRFWTGPDLNAEMANFLLECRAGTWTVIERDFAAYPD